MDWGGEEGDSNSGVEAVSPSGQMGWEGDWQGILIWRSGSLCGIWRLNHRWRTLEAIQEDKTAFWGGGK